LIFFYIALGGCLGAVLRFSISKRLNNGLPVGTFLVNMLGSFLLGYFFSLGLSKHIYAFLGSGFCGAFTTFSTLKLESFQFIREGRKFTSIIYIIVSYLVGTLLAFSGFYIAKV
jgi:fluoride exporter